MNIIMYIFVEIRFTDHGLKFKDPDLDPKSLGIKIRSMKKKY